jgi:hypothetical protein
VSTAPSVGRAVDAARSALRGALGDRLRVAGPDRTEALAMDSALITHDASVSVLAGELRAHRIAAPDVAVFAGFLDGIQRSATIAYVDGVPLLHGTAAAAIRCRDGDGRMLTWSRPRIDHAIYASFALLGDAMWSRVAAVLGARGHALTNTDARTPEEQAEISRHPSSLLRQALDALSKRRDTLEREIGEAWCKSDAPRALYVDGSLRTSSLMLRSEHVVGVVKSHARLYVPQDQLPLLMSLQASHRTSVLAVLDEKNRAVFHTWYLRLRSADGRDPFFGLIRVEVGARDVPVADIETRADTISGWLLAERAPLARPDARWDVMPYAIRDCEVYLRAVA